MNTKALSKVLNNPEISEFLSFYPTSQRQEVLKIAILHTVYSLKSTSQAYPSLEQLKDVMSNAGKMKSLESTIFEMKSKLELIKKEISSLECNLSTPAPKPEPPRPSLEQPYRKLDPVKPDPVHRSWSAPHITKAPSTWRQGDPSVFRNGHVELHPGNSKNFLFRQVSPPSLRNHHYKEFLTNNDSLPMLPNKDPDIEPTKIYPEWWMALTELDVKPAKLTSKVTQQVPPKPAIRSERRQWPEPNVAHRSVVEEGRTLPPRQKTQNTVKFTPQTSEKSAEANFESAESSGNDARVHFSDKKYSGWVGDFSKVVKNPSSKPSNSISKEISYTDSSRKDHSSGYTSSSMTNYVPNSEMRQFYQGEFNRFLESRNGESYGSGRLKSPYHNSMSSEEHKFGFEL